MYRLDYVKHKDKVTIDDITYTCYLDDSLSGHDAVYAYLCAQLFEAFDILIDESQLFMSEDRFGVMFEDVALEHSITTYAELFPQSDNTDIDTVLNNLKKYQNVPELYKHFIKLFLVDFITGNICRSPESFGLLNIGNKTLMHLHGYMPNCLCNYITYKQMKDCEYDIVLFNDIVYKKQKCYFKHDGEDVIPLKFLSEWDEPILGECLFEVLETPFSIVESRVKDCPVLLAEEKEFLLQLLRRRYNLLQTLAYSKCKGFVQYFENYNIAESNKQSELNRLMCITGSKSLRELSEYLAENFL